MPPGFLSLFTRSLALAPRLELALAHMHSPCVVRLAGFGDRGLHAVAAFSEGLEVLRLGGCAVSDKGLVKVAINCAKLSSLEVTEPSQCAVAP